MNDYEKLQNLITDLLGFINANYDPYSIELTAWKKRCVVFLSNHYGEDSIELKEFERISFFPKFPTGKGASLPYCQKQLTLAKEYLWDLSLNMDKSSSNPENIIKNNSVFLVHGHDEAFKLKIKDLLTKLEIESIILHEQANVGRTIIEKIEHFGKNVGAAIILYTPDDMGKANKEPDYKSRARQNVIFESGFFMGYLGRNKVTHVVFDSSMEIPGDLGGVVYVDKSNWQFDLVKELKAMGFEVDANRLL